MFDSKTLNKIHHQMGFYINNSKYQFFSSTAFKD